MHTRMHFCLLCQAKQEAIPADFDFDNSSNEPSGGLFNFLDFFIGDNLRGGLFRGWHVKICLVVGHIPIDLSHYYVICDKVRDALW